MGTEAELRMGTVRVGPGRTRKVLGRAGTGHRRVTNGTQPRVDRHRGITRARDLAAPP
jgi:hypothetical protein